MLVCKTSKLTYLQVLIAFNMKKRKKILLQATILFLNKVDAKLN